MSKTAKMSMNWQSPVGDGDATIQHDSDAWYAYPGTGGSAFYFESGRYHIAEDWNREGGEFASDQARAFGSGLVVFDGVMSGYGNTVILDHGVASDGQTHLFSLYAHLATTGTFGTDLWVTAGQDLGQIGASGGNYAVHLHFELFDAESWVIAVNLSGGSATLAEIENAQSLTFDDLGNITSVVLMGEVDSTRPGQEYMRAFTSDYFIDTAADRARWYDGDGADIFELTGKSAVEAFGLGGDDSLRGGSANDLLAGGSGNDSLNGGKGGDEMYGDAGNDVLNGKAGQRDDMQGGSGSDTLISAGQGDTLIGGSSPLPSAPELWGDGAKDVFKFTFGARGTATIVDFEDGIDRIKLVGLAQGPDDLTITSTQGGARITVADLTILVNGIEAADLGANDFLF